MLSKTRHFFKGTGAGLRVALDDSCALPSTASQDQYDSSALTCRSNPRGSRESVLSDIVDQEHATVVAELRGGAMWEFSVRRRSWGRGPRSEPGGLSPAALPRAAPATGRPMWTWMRPSKYSTGGRSRPGSGQHRSGLNWKWAGWPRTSDQPIMSYRGPLRCGSNSRFPPRRKLR
jgi:hypothetical protein